MNYKNAIYILLLSLTLIVLNAIGKKGLPENTEEDIKNVVGSNNKQSLTPNTLDYSRSNPSNALIRLKTLDQIKKQPEKELSLNNSEIKNKIHHSESSFGIDVNDIPKEISNNMNSLFQSAQKADWQSFMESLDVLESIDYQTLNLALFQAVLNNAPFAIIENLLNRGAQFNPQTIKILAIKNNISLTQKLLPYGLDIFSVDEDGQNAINQTLISLQAKEMFDFLIMNGVNVKPNSQSIDPLSVSLRHLSRGNINALYYIEKLVNYGAPIETVHIEILRQIKLDNINVYRHLVEKMPELSELIGINQ